MRILYIISFITILFSACEPKEVDTPKPLTNDSSRVVVADLGENYADQVLFNIENGNTTLKSKYAFDISVYFKDGEANILLNEAKIMYAYNTGKTNFDSVYNYNKNLKKFDQSLGNMDSIVFSNINNQIGKVYLIDLGVINGSSPVQIGNRKLQVTAANATSISFKHSKLDNTDVQTATITNNGTTLLQSFNLQNNTPVAQFHSADNWDIIFTQYKDSASQTFSGQTFFLNDYDVQGAICREGISISKLNNKDYNSFTLNDVSGITFTNNWNGIGYDWKIAKNVTTNPTFDIVDKRVYVLKVKNDIYKLRFLDFYNAQGKTGAIKFEYKKL